MCVLDLLKDEYQEHTSIIPHISFSLTGTVPLWPEASSKWAGLDPGGLHMGWVRVRIREGSP